MQKDKEMDNKNDKFRYEFDPATGIMFKIYLGPVTLADINESWIYAFENGLIPKETIGFVLDYRQAYFKLIDEVHAGIPVFYRKHLDIFGGKKIAIITESAKDIIVPILVEQEDFGYQSRPFSTKQAAIAWVLS